MMDICTAHEAKTKSPLNTQSRSKTNQSHKSEVPENPARKNCCLHLGRTTLEISLLISIIINMIFFWYTIWNLLTSAECAEGEQHYGYFFYLFATHWIPNIVPRAYTYHQQM